MRRHLSLTLINILSSPVRPLWQSQTSGRRKGFNWHTEVWGDQFEIAWLFWWAVETSESQQISLKVHLDTEDSRVSHDRQRFVYDYRWLSFGIPKGTRLGESNLVISRWEKIANWHSASPLAARCQHLSALGSNSLVQMNVRVLRFQLLCVPLLD